MKYNKLYTIATALQEEFQKKLIAVLKINGFDDLKPIVKININEIDLDLMPEEAVEKATENNLKYCAFSVEDTNVHFCSKRK